jgi:hypothetical protein
MVSKAVHLSEEEAEGLQQLLAETGESEEEILRRATARGLRDLRLEQAIQAFKDGRSSGEAAKIAGLPRAIFLDTLLDRGVEIDGGPSTLGPALAALGRSLGDKRLIKAAEHLAVQDT